MNYKPEIAIIESNTLTCLGLKSILEEIIPMATIRTFHSFSELMDDTPDMYAHYFISAQIYVEHNAFFLPRKRKTIVLASDSPQFQLSGVPVLNIYEPEEKLVKSLLKLHHQALHNGYPVRCLRMQRCKCLNKAINLLHNMRINCRHLKTPDGMASAYCFVLCHVSPAFQTSVSNSVTNSPNNASASATGFSVVISTPAIFKRSIGSLLSPPFKKLM